VPDDLATEGLGQPLDRDLDTHADTPHPSADRLLSRANERLAARLRAGSHRRAPRHARGAAHPGVIDIFI
jgi:hypothetical protein